MMHFILVCKCETLCCGCFMHRHHSILSLFFLVVVLFLHIYELVVLVIEFILQEGKFL